MSCIPQRPTRYVVWSERLTDNVRRSHNLPLNPFTHLGQRERRMSTGFFGWNVFLKLTKRRGTYRLDHSLSSDWQIWPERVRKNACFRSASKENKAHCTFDSRTKDMWRFIQGPLAVLTSTWAFPADCSGAHMHSSAPKQSLRDHKAAHSNSGHLRPRGQRL